MPSLHIQLLGDFRLIMDEARAVNLDSARLQSFLAYFLLRRHAPQSRRRLAFLFWPDSTEAQARTNLRKQIYHLRRAWPDADNFLEMDGQMLQWRHGIHFELDVAELEAALAQANAAEENGEHQTLREALQQVAALYRGELLPDCYDDWIIPERERLHRAVCHALDRLLPLLEHQRDYPGAIAVAQRRLYLDPLHEPTYRRLMRLHALNDDPELVTRIYRQCETVLKRELNVEPGPATRQTYESLQNRQERLQRPSPSLGTPLVGRRVEWERLMNAWRKTTAGNPRFALLAGEAGVGKTRLVEELIEWAQRQGIAVAAAYCYAIEHGLIYSPVVTWLRAAPVRDFVTLLDDVWLTEIARLLPELLGRRPDLQTPEPLLEAWQRQRLYEGLARALLAHNRPLLLVLEDIQWSDRETLEWLHFFLRFDRRAPLLIVATMRAEEVIGDHPLLPLLLELRRSGDLMEVELDPLDASGTTTLATQVAGRALDPQTAGRLFRETEGNPLFIVEMIRAGRLETGSSTTPPATPANPGPDLPPRVQAVIESRLAQLSHGTLELAGLAAVIGNSFSFAVLAAASGREPETVVEALDELRQRRIIREQGVDRYDFTHDKIRHGAYTGLSSARRRLFHWRIAEVLETAHADELEAVSVQLTSHFEQAGILYKALQYCTMAAERAAGVYAYRDAEQLYARAIDIAERLNWPGAERTTLYAGRGRMLEHQGRFADAVEVYEQLLTMAQERDDTAMQTAAIGRLAACYIEPSDVHSLSRAERFIEEGLRLAREIDDHEREAHLLWCLMMRATHYGHHDEARAAGEQCLAIARQYNLKRQQSLALHDLAVNLRLSGAVEVGTAYAEEARALFRELGSLPLLADSLNQQALLDYLHLDLPAALRYANEAYEISRRINNGWNQSYATWIRGMVYSARGQWDLALATWEESIERGERAAFVMALTTVRMLYGALLRDIGLLDRAEAIHRQAQAASEETASFMLSAAESQLALDAFAAANLAGGRRWLRRALGREPLGEIGTALALRWPPTAAVAAAERDGDWASALQIVDNALTDARRRRLALHKAYLTYERGRCLAALERPTHAEAELLEALSIARSAELRSLQRESHGALFRLYRSQGRPDEAERQRRAALALVDELAANLSHADRRRSFLATESVRLLRPAASG